jgi:energy-coupling factor transporter transmembrane protein EcfT
MFLMSQSLVFPFFLSNLHPPPKACTIISMNADALRVILVTFLVAIYLVAVSYLRRRKLSNLAYAFWGMFALLLPAFGPFFVIAYRPGNLVPRKRSRHGARAERSQSFRK